jgi:hopanoid biosynthesis associated protein HpnK
MSRLNNSSVLARRAIIVADDFGRSESINRAVIQAHQEGVLTCASLMVSGEAWEEAVELAQANPRLGVGLHLTLACGRSVLTPDLIPNLVNQRGEFSSSPVRAGFRYFFGRKAGSDLTREIEAQFDRFRNAGLALDHVNGHLNMHLHPTVLPLVMQCSQDFECRAVRLTRDPLALNLRLASGRVAYRLSHAVIFGCLSALAKGKLKTASLRSADRVLGLLQSGDMNPAFVARLLRELPEGATEIYFHPDATEGGNVDLKTLLDPEVKELLKTGDITPIRYEDL